MNYYKIIKESLSAQMAEYAEAAAAADKAADELAAEIGADTFVPSPYGEFGGLIACTFPEGKVPHTFHFSEEVDGVRYFEPAVIVEESVESDKFVLGLDRRMNNRNWYEVRELSLEQAKNMLSHSRAEELAHIHWDKGPNLTQLAQKYRVSPVWMTLYFQGRLDFAILCGKSRGYGLPLNQRLIFDEELRNAMELEQLLDEKLSKRKLYRVQHVKGPTKAVSLYRRCATLPIVPAGRLAGLLGVTFPAKSVSCPAFFKCGDHWYIATSGTMVSDAAEEISEYEYKTAEMNRGE